MEKIKQFQQDIAAFISSCNFSGTPEGLYEPISYTILQKGKRLRPMLCLLANEMFDGDENEALWASVALETLHNFTLIHDDIMDRAPLRRGMETVYQKWNENVAILSGDTMIAMAYEFALKTKNGAMAARLLSKVTREVCEGQQYDLNFETQNEVTLEEYLEMIRLKTAVLLATSLQMGAMLANAGEDDIKALYDFGINIGMSFQLKDDILDLYSDAEVFGKRHGGDIVENKKTYLFLRALELAGATDRERLKQLFSMRIDHEADEKIAEVKAIYDKLHIKEEVEKVIKEYDAKAFASLDRVKASEEKKKHLRTYAEMLYGRIK